MKKPHINAPEKRTLAVHTLGSVAYQEASALQNKLHTQRLHEEISDTLLLLEHPNVITIGKRGVQSDILAPPSILEQNRVSIAQTPRGGQVTLHTPGQLIGYFIFHLYNKQRAAHAFVHSLEQVLIDALASFSISAHHDEKHTGVWVGGKKIASIGISISRGVTQHGFALNVANNLDAFSWIVPCGMPQVGLTSIASLLKNAPPMNSVCHAIIEALATQMRYCDIIKHTSVPEW